MIDISWSLYTYIYIVLMGFKNQRSHHWGHPIVWCSYLMYILWWNHEDISMVHKGSYPWYFAHLFLCHKYQVIWWSYQVIWWFTRFYIMISTHLVLSMSEIWWFTQIYHSYEAVNSDDLTPWPIKVASFKHRLNAHKHPNGEGLWGTNHCNGICQCVVWKLSWKVFVYCQAWLPPDNII